MDNKESDYEFRLRDQAALAALPLLIQRFTEKNNSKWIDEKGITEDFKECAEAIALMAYRIADEMRKARLKSFA